MELIHRIPGSADILRMRTGRNGSGCSLLQAWVRRNNNDYICNTSTTKLQYYCTHPNTLHRARPLLLWRCLCTWGNGHCNIRFSRRFSICSDGTWYLVCYHGNCSDGTRYTLLTVHMYPWYITYVIVQSRYSEVLQVYIQVPGEY